MRRWGFVLGMSVSAMVWGQTMTEFGLGAAAGTAGGASGKAVSQGVSSIFNKLNQTTNKAAQTGEAKAKDPALQVSDGVVKDDSGVPAPPEPRRAPKRQDPVYTTASQVLDPALFPQATIAEAAPELPPPPTMTAEKLRQVAAGMNRREVLHLGDPSSRVTMDQGGHLVETFSYRENGQWIGRVKVVDGSVAGVETK